MSSNMSSNAIATLVQIMESLPDNIQVEVVEHLKEYIQQTNINLPTSSNGNLENSGEITTQEAKKGFDVEGFNWDEWERRVEAANPDPEELTTEEICEIVREVRRENRRKA